MSKVFDEDAFTTRLRDQFMTMAAVFLRTGKFESAGLFRKPRSDVQMIFNLAIAGVKIEESLSALAGFADGEFIWPALPPRSILDDLNQVKISGGWSSKQPKPESVFELDDLGLRPVWHCVCMWRSGVSHSSRTDVRLLERTLGDWVRDVLIPVMAWARSSAIEAPAAYGIQLQAQQFAFKESVYYDEEPMWWA